MGNTLFYISARKEYPRDIGEVYDPTDGSETQYKIGKDCKDCQPYKDVKEEILEKVERAYKDLAKGAPP
ncbi:MAG: hypothetical protein GWO20_09625 [Candidatus Korarchaeota archaeon]|nr:hypothetical protein [Candidatus Korarchaeota archaeon]NIU83715.1 hypothetical protein [Candidatus Thorarchaeota archaeon]NIW52033.1 hypothetical protein [Candidatus Korarchaeota archaeon]